jgi:hypothetical protein
MKCSGRISDEIGLRFLYTIFNVFSVRYIGILSRNSHLLHQLASRFGYQEAKLILCFETTAYWFHRINPRFLVRSPFWAANCKKTIVIDRGLLEPDTQIVCGGYERAFVSARKIVVTREARSERTYSGCKLGQSFHTLCGASIVS